MDTIENESGTFDIGGTRTVRRLGFGAMRLCGPDILGPPADTEAALAVARRAVELGIDLIDTADAYGPGVDERLLEEALAPYPDRVVIATKGGLLRSTDGDWLPHGDPEYLENAVLCSLDRLGVDRIDLYQFHRPDPDVGFETSVRALASLRDAGYIEHVGLSNVTVEQLDRAREIVPIATVQNRFNLIDREHEPVLEACEADGIGFLPYFPLDAGDLSTESGVVAEIAAAHDATPAQIAIAWLLDRSPVMLPIPGTASIEHLEENVAATGISLNDDERRRLDRAA